MCSNALGDFFYFRIMRMIINILCFCFVSFLNIPVFGQQSGNIFEINLAASRANIRQANYFFTGNGNGNYMEGPTGIGLNYERKISSTVGLGFETTYQETTWNYAPNQSPIAKYNRLRIMMLMHLHLLSNTGSINNDVYMTLGGGYKVADFILYDKEGYESYFSPLLEPFFEFPVAVKLALGYRHIFNNNITMKGEISAGGPILVGGIGYKF